VCSVGFWDTLRGLITGRPLLIGTAVALAFLGFSDGNRIVRGIHITKREETGYSG